ncbi:universal stress protein [Natrarchaeobaculum sulfurireducens]|uniref:universal stress protein n=1 Tax=Natrarchaeobaculum sulfurireducens TaxID=2044521 RepID=UPI000E3E85F6|nr:universal stress protein [Natrarchaeobaculum sulfurireducens]
MYQNVLIPTDGGDGTRRSIEHGLTLADRFDATVHALSVVPEGPFGTFEGERATVAAERAIEQVAIEADTHGIEAATAVEYGIPHEEILAYVDANDVDVIVMGTQGRTGLDRVLVGSVTERIVRMADVPVVTVKLTDDLRIQDSDEVERIATAEANQAGYDDVTVIDDPHRTSASWVVSLEADGDSVQVHVDAVSGESRIARSQDAERSK